MTTKTVFGPRIPESLVEGKWLTITPAPIAGFPDRVMYNKSEIESLPMPDTLESDSCGMCYVCVTSVECGKCSVRNNEIHEIYVEWYNRLYNDYRPRRFYGVAPGEIYQRGIMASALGSALEAGERVDSVPIPWSLVHGRQDSLELIFSN